MINAGGRAQTFKGSTEPDTPLWQADGPAIDDRPHAEADLLSWRPLPQTGSEASELWFEMAAGMCDQGAQEIRMTIVSPDYPMPPYPDALYMEGWFVAPHRMTPPHKAAPFNFPVTA